MKRQESAYLGVVICLQPSEKTSVATDISTHHSSARNGTPQSNPIPIGTIGLHRDTQPNRIQHRNVSLNIRLLKDFRSQGYGSEAIEWALDWGFRRAELHKIKIGHVGWNLGAGKLYQRMGFVREAMLREELWHDGKWWDLIDMSMLEQEYWARDEEKKKEQVIDTTRVE